MAADSALTADISGDMTSIGDMFGFLLMISLIQGITEFLPISSSGHLVLLPALTGRADQGQLFDVAAHVGTLLAVLWYLRADLIRMAAATLSFGRADKAAFQLALTLIYASIPAILAGLLVALADPSFLRLAITVALANLAGALWLWWADSRARTQHDHTGDVSPFEAVAAITVKQGVIIGFAQILALIPGASRSGVTMTMARQLHLPRLTAARFSMLLSVPVIAGAGTLKTADLISEGGLDVGPALLSVILLSALFAFIAIRLMMGWLAKADFRIFVWYRLALAGFLFIAIAAGYIQ